MVGVSPRNAHVFPDVGVRLKPASSTKTSVAPSASFFEPRPGCTQPGCARFLVPLLGFTFRLLITPSKLVLEDLAHVIRVKLDTKLVLDDQRDAICRPKVRVETACLGSRHEYFQEVAQLIRRQPRRSVRGRSTKTFHPTLSNCGGPATHRRLTHAVFSCDLSLLNAILKLARSGQPASFHLLAAQSRPVKNGSYHQMMLRRSTLESLRNECRSL